MNDHLQIAVTVNQACKAASLSRRTLYEAIRAKQLKTKKLGKKTLILIADLHAWLDALPDGVAQ